MMLWIIAALIGVGVFLLGFSFGVYMSEATAAVLWFREHAKAETARRKSVEEVRAAWREKRERERNRAALINEPAAAELGELDGVN